MKDNKGRTIEYLRLSVTDLCNYRCTYCMPESGVHKLNHSDILSIEELTHIARTAVACGIKKIRLTGGEPLVRHGIIELCKNLKSIPGLEELAMTTNGSLLAHYANDLKSAGVDRLNISIDTLNKKKFKSITRCGELNQVLDGLSAAKSAGFSNIKINTVLINDFNVNEILDFIALTKDDDFSVRFIELMPIGECMQWPKERFISAETVLDICPSLVPTKTDGVATLYYVPGYKGTVGLIRPMTACFCNQCNRIRITTDGKLKPCLHSEDEIPLRGLSGDVLKQAIKKGIFYKPTQHYLNENKQSKTKRNMNEIGG